MRRWALLLVILAAPAHAVSFSTHHAGPPAERRVGTKVRPPTPQAFFHLGYSDLNTVRFYQDWFWPYSLIVGDVQLSATDVANLSTGPGVTLIGDISAQSLPIYLGFSNTYNNHLQAAWDSAAFCIYEIDSSKCLKVSGSYQWCPRQESVDVFVANVRDYAYGLVDWQGMFLDECTLDYPAYKETILGSTAFDCDGDGVADSKQKLEAQWHTWQPYLTEQLRAISGSKILVGNSAGPLGDGNLNGITIENVGGGGSFPDSTTAISYINAQKAVSQAPFVGGVFARSQAEVLSCMAVVNSIPGVYYFIHTDDAMP